MSDTKKTTDVANKPDSKPKKPAEKTDNKTTAGKVEKPIVKKTKAIKLPVVSLLALLIGMAALATSSWLWQDQQKSQQTIKATLSQLKGTLADTANQESVAALATTSEHKIAGLEANIQRINTNQQALNDSITALNKAISRDQRAWILAEIEYLMRIAMQRLHIESDYHAAIAALQAADLRLEELADPALLPLRQQINADVARLQAAPRVDLAGISLQLVNLATRVQRLGLAHNTVPTSEQIVVGQAAVDNEAKPLNDLPFAAALWEKLNALVSISETKGNQKRLLKTGVIEAKRNINEWLTFARYAVLRKDETDFKTQLARALELYSATFDTRHEQATTLLNDMQQLAAQSLFMTPPDISASLTLLKKFTTSTPPSKQSK